jgi:Protein of unknown function (DUF2878)
MSTAVIVNFVLFQAAWFACVLGAAHAMPWLGVIATIYVLAWHFMQAKTAKPEAILLTITLMIGAVFDQVMLSSNLIHYQSHGWSDALVPAWILALWAGFVTALNVSLRWMQGKWLVAVLFGAIGGPLAYIGAERLGAVTLNAYPQSYLALSIGWAILTPVLLMLAKRYDGFQNYQSASND